MFVEQSKIEHDKCSHNIFDDLFVGLIVNCGWNNSYLLKMDLGLNKKFLGYGQQNEPSNVILY